MRFGVNYTLVIPGLVPGIHLYVCTGACGTMDPGHKARDDK